jgi:hypothetical protein
MGHENYRIWIDQNMTTGSYISSGAIDRTYGTGPLVPDQKESHKYLSIKSLEVWSPSGEQTFLNFKERQKTLVNLEHIKNNLTNQCGYISDPYAVIEQRMSNTKTLNRTERNTSQSPGINTDPLSLPIKIFDPCFEKNSAFTPLSEEGELPVKRNIIPAFD